MPPLIVLSHNKRLSGDWLEEQLEGQRQLSGMVNSLAVFRRDHEELADWMYSRQLAEKQQG